MSEATKFRKNFITLNAKVSIRFLSILGDCSPEAVFNFFFKYSMVPGDFVTL